MKKILAVVGLAAALVLPASSLAKPNHAEKRAAKAQCKDERGHTRATREAFRARYHGFANCVRQNAAEEEAENDAAGRTPPRSAGRSAPRYAESMRQVVQDA